jgi:hypothetical protein
VRQEREKKDLEVYNSLKHQFSVEESGNLTDSVQIFENKIENFIEEVKVIHILYSYSYLSWRSLFTS